MKLIILIAVLLFSFIANRIAETVKQKQRHKRCPAPVPDDVWPYEPAVPQAPPAPVPAVPEPAVEGERVTADTPVMEKPKRSGRRPVRVPAGGLREAFMWSEIFRRKY